MEMYIYSKCRLIENDICYRRFYPNYCTLDQHKVFWFVVFVSTAVVANTVRFYLSLWRLYIYACLLCVRNRHFLTSCGLDLTVDIAQMTLINVISWNDSVFIFIEVCYFSRVEFKIESACVQVMNCLDTLAWSDDNHCKIWKFKYQEYYVETEISSPSA